MSALIVKGQHMRLVFFAERYKTSFVLLQATEIAFYFAAIFIHIAKPPGQVAQRRRERCRNIV